MAESIQTYYKKLISLQNESIQKNLIKYELTEWDNVAPTLTNKEREFILKRYREGSNHKAATFFREIVVRAQLNEAAQKKAAVHSGKQTTKKDIVGVTSNSSKTKTTKYRSLQDYYMYLVSKQLPSIREFLRKNDLLKHENAFVWLDDSDLEFIMNGYTIGFRLRANDLGKIFSKLCNNYLSHQPKSDLASQLQQNSTQKEESPKLVQLDKPKLACQEAYHPTILLQQLVLEDAELPVIQEEDLSQKSQFEDSTLLRSGIFDRLFAQWIDILPVWYIEALMKNGCTNLTKLVEEISKPTFSYKGRKHCGQEVVDELRTMTATLIWLYLQFKSNVEEPDETTKYLLSRISNSGLSIRAVNCLETIEIKTIKDLLPLSHGVLLAMRNCGKKTVSEIEQFIVSVKQRFNIPESLTTTQVEKYLKYNLRENVSLKLSQLRELGVQTEIVEMFTQQRGRISSRAKYLLKENGFRSYNDFVEKTSKTKFAFKDLNFCGQKSIDELGFLMFFLAPQIETLTKDPIVKYVSKTDFEYTILFRNEYGHWPMMYILLSYMWSTLPLLEFVAFEENYGIIKPQEETDELTKLLVRQSYNEASRKVRMNPDIKQLCEHEEWNLYCVNNIPDSFFNNEDEDGTWRKIEEMLSQEKVFLNSYIRERASSDEEYKNRAELLSHINLYTFKVLLQFWEYKPYWIDWSKRVLLPSCPINEIERCDLRSIIVINRRFESFKFNQAFYVVGRLQKEKTSNDIVLSIKKYFVDNEDYWKKTIHLSSNEDKAFLVYLLKKLFREVCHSTIVEDNLILKANQVDYGDILYEILYKWGTRLHRDELFKLLKEACEKRGLRCNLSSPSQLTRFLASDPRIISYGKSSYWGLKEWGESNGSIRELAIQFVKKSKEPIHIDDLTKLVMGNRPDSNEKSISSIIRQTTSTGELLLFIGDYIGHPQAKYVGDYILMPRSFDEWLIAFKDCVLKNKRFPTAGLGFEGLLYRWYQKASQLTELLPDEIIKFDTLEKELAHYPHNTNEYNFLHNCNLYKMFVEGNNRMLEETDDPELFKWFYSASRYYTTYNDNRNLYFKQLLQYLSSKLY